MREAYEEYHHGVLSAKKLIFSDMFKCPRHDTKT